MRIKVRAEEILIGATLGAGLGLAFAAPLAVGMPSLIPDLAAGVFPFAQSALAAALALAGAGVGGWLAAHQERDSHVRGAHYFSDFHQARQQLQAGEARQFSAKQAAGEVHGIEIGGVQLARSRETGHIYAVGLPGSGKTVLLTSLIDQAIARGERIILHDPKGDFIERYYNPATTVLLGPWDQRAAVWDASADIDSPALADEFGTSVAGRVEGQNKFFHDAAGMLLAGLIRAVQRDGAAWSWKDLIAALAAEPEALIRRAADGNAQIKTALPSAFTGDDMTAVDRAVLSVLGASAQWLANYAAIDAHDTERPRFSLRRWLTHEAHEDVQIAILNSHAVYQSACESIFGAMLSTVAAVASSPVLPEISADADGGYWLVLDEFPQMGATALAKIQQIAEVGRSRGMRLVTALQDESQLDAKAGHEKAGPMLSMQSTRIYMRSSDKTAEAVSRRIGEREVLRIDSTAQDGAIAGKTKRADKQTVVQPSDILGLRVRLHEEPHGVELVMHVEDTLGRLVQAFPPRTAVKATRLIESETWRRGSLPEPEAAPDDDPGPLPFDDDSEGDGTGALQQEGLQPPDDAEPADSEGSHDFF